MDASSLFGLIGLTITNIAAVLTEYLRQKKYNRINYGVKNGRGDLYKQVGALYDLVYKDVGELKTNMAELRGMFNMHIQELPCCQERQKH